MHALLGYIIRGDIISGTCQSLVFVPQTSNQNYLEFLLKRIRPLKISDGVNHLFVRIQIFHLGVGPLTDVAAELHPEMNALHVPLEAELTTEALPTIHTLPLGREQRQRITMCCR